MSTGRQSVDTRDGTVHLVYPVGESIATPYAITRELAMRLRRRMSVQVHDWEDTVVVRPSPGDVLVGHPHPWGNRIFTNSFRLTGWRKRIVMLPFRHNPYIEQMAWLDPLICQSDHFLAICGRYWTDTMDDSLTSHWKAKTTQLDLAVNREHYPFLKQHFGPRGGRRFVYIGHTAPYKGCDYLAQLAEANPHLHIAWIGTGSVPSRRVVSFGQMDFATDEARRVIQDYDFLITCGRSDPNPTTILEAASWGLVPICTPQSGYYRENWVTNIPLDDVAGASAVLNRLNEEEEEALRELQCAAREALERHYNWDRFARQVVECIEAPVPVRERGMRSLVRRWHNRLFLRCFYDMLRIRRRFACRRRSYRLSVRRSQT